ncbi:MAG: 4-alpha-glucanotransferase [Ferruginibacter sp.]
MMIHFYVGFRSEHGQSIAIKIVGFTKEGGLTVIELPLHFLNDGYWHLILDTASVQLSDEFEYTYIFRDSNRNEEKEFCKNSSVNLQKFKVKCIDIIDEWNDVDFHKEVFSSTPFTDVFRSTPHKLKVTDTKNATHIFKVKAPSMASGKVICLTGGNKKMNEWDTKNPLFLEQKKQYWVLKLNLSKEHFPIQYKLGIYNIVSGNMQYEDGNNRVLPTSAEKGTLTILNHTIDTARYRWRGAGINISVSSLKSNNSWGVGDFTDMKLLTDLAKQMGLRMIQLLPINDTTSSHTNKDSYPYSAVSAFALHPIFLNVQQLAKSLSVQFPESMLKKVAEFNTADTLHYEEIQAIKKDAISQLYEKDKALFKDDFGWFSFFDLNRHWLVPYAAYCYLREKHQTADYNSWPDFAAYNEDQIQELVSPENDFYDHIAIHYFTQYHLHLQLKDAVDYAHKSGIIIKGDLPIGVGKHSCDAWMYQSLFHLNMQAGAPPDAFATKGQNWSFPTYNWENMAEDDYAWWRQRMEQMSNYFDAIRIDHVLGFFRIWSIPSHAIEGILGKFIPAWPLSKQDFNKAGLHFTEDRICQPYITEQLLYDWFGSDAAVVKDEFLHLYSFKAEFNTQRKIAAYCATHQEHAHLQYKLFDLLSNVIALKDDSNPFHYHLRIGMQATDSYKALPYHEQAALNKLYVDYFFNNQNKLWEEEGIKKLTVLKRSTNMMICAEDLGMVPAMVEGVLNNLQMLALEVQRMPKRTNDEFSDPRHSPYLSVVTPGTHDMATIREWWEEDPTSIQRFYNHQLAQQGDAPYFAESWLCRNILQQHLQSPAMWAVFLLQDLLSIDDQLRKEDPRTERINNPANPDHFWNYRMHLTLEALCDEFGFLVTMKNMVLESGRG